MSQRSVCEPGEGWEVGGGEPVGMGGYGGGMGGMEGVWRGIKGV